MNEYDDKLTVEELAKSVDVPVRTVRFYIAQGLIPGPGSRGRSAAYGEDHALRLRLVRRLVDRHVPLSEIKARMHDLALDDVRSILEKEEREEGAHAACRDVSPKEFVSGLLNRARAYGGTASSTRTADGRSAAPSLSRAGVGAPPQPAPAAERVGEVWQRWELLPGVELHVRRDLEMRYRSLIDRILRSVDSRAKSESE